MTPLSEEIILKGNRTNSSQLFFFSCPLVLPLKRLQTILDSFNKYLLGIDHMWAHSGLQGCSPQMDSYRSIQFREGVGGWTLAQVFWRGVQRDCQRSWYLSLKWEGKKKRGGQRCQVGRGCSSEERRGEEIVGNFSICSLQWEETWQRWGWRTTGPEHQGLVRHVQEFWFHPGWSRGATERLSLCSDRWHLGFHQGSDRVKVMFLQNQLSCGSETESGGAGPEAGRAFSKASLLRDLGVKTQPPRSAPFLVTWLH